MHIKIVLLVVTFLLMLFLIVSAFAWSMLCITHVVSSGGRHGPGMYEVLKKCGEPTFRQGNTWIYEISGKRRKVLRFNDSGLLVKVSG